MPAEKRPPNHSSKGYFQSWLYFFSDVNSHRSLPKLTVSDVTLQRNRRRQRFFFFHPLTGFLLPPLVWILLTNGCTHVLFSMKLSFILHDNESWDQPLLRKKNAAGWLRKLPDVERFDVFLALVNILWCFDEHNPVWRSNPSLHRHHGVHSAVLAFGCKRCLAVFPASVCGCVTFINKLAQSLNGFLGDLTPPHSFLEEHAFFIGSSGKFEMTINKETACSSAEECAVSRKWFASLGCNFSRDTESSNQRGDGGFPALDRNGRTKQTAQDQ